MELKNKKVLVTGAGGFIGSHLVEQLLEENAEVKAFVHYNSFNRWGWLDSFTEDELAKIEVFAGDITDSSGVRTAVKGAEIIFHLAALIGIPYSYHSPATYVDTNIKGTLNILQAAREFSIDKVLVTSTSEVYGSALYVPIDEKHPKQGQSPYSATKIGADYLAQSFYRSFDLPVTIVRPFNTFGPRQSARAIIPTLITQLCSSTTDLKVGSLHPTRDFVYVKDTARGFIEIAKAERTVGQEINIATQREISIGDLIEKIIELTRSQAKICLDRQRVRPEKSEVERLLGSNNKITELTSWHARYGLEQGLQETIQWFNDKSNLQFYKTHLYNV